MRKGFSIRALVIPGALLLCAGFFLIGSDPASSERGPNTVPDKEARLKQIQKALGYRNLPALKNDFKEFSKRVKAGFAPKGYFDTCSKNFASAMCATLKTYFDESNRPKMKRRDRKRVRVRFSTKYLTRLQNTDFPILHRRFPKWSLKRLDSTAKITLKRKASCPQNFSIALALELEEKKLTNARKKQIAALWKRGLECVKASDPWAEYVLLRAALSQIAFGLNKEALALIDRALAAEDLDEDYRSHYWKHHLLKQLGRKSEARKLAGEISQKFLLSWYWINIAHEYGIDPLEQIKARPVIPDQVAANDPKIDPLILWLKAGLELEEDPSDLRLYSEWVIRKVIALNNIGLSQYLSRLLFEAKQYRFQIFVLSKVILEQPEKFNKEHLELLFPKPYFEKMKQHSGELDTAILLGLARQESGFDTYARSSADARGLLQLLPSTARTMSKKISAKELYAYERNIQLGARYFLKLVRRFDGSVEDSLAAYNAGATNARRWRSRYPWAKDLQLFVDIIPFRETRDYVPSVLRNAYWYYRIFPSLHERGKGKVISGTLLSDLLQKVSPKEQRSR